MDIRKKLIQEKKEFKSVLNVSVDKEIFLKIDEIAKDSKVTRSAVANSLLFLALEDLGELHSQQSDSKSLNKSEVVDK